MILELLTKNYLKLTILKNFLKKKRNYFFDKIKDKFAHGIGVGVCDHEIIDKINILQASFLAMKKAISELKEKPQIILVDGSQKIPNFNIQQETIIRG